MVTGFLGSGKTTLIGRILATPGYARTAVIVNEFGEIGLDHELIAASDETLLALTTGCLCCAVRGDLIETLLDLQMRREAGAIAFDRVLIETSGLADPAPILHALMTDPGIKPVYQIDGLVTVVDAVHGAAALDRHPEARRQVALADRLVLSKTDLVGPPAPKNARKNAKKNVMPANAGTHDLLPGKAGSLGLNDHLTTLNPTAPITPTTQVTPDTIFSLADPNDRAERLTRLPDQPAASPFTQARHTKGIETFVLQRDTPIPALALTLLLQALTEHCGARLLRVKGLIDIEEMPGQPAMIHGVQHVFTPPEFLERWPAEDRTTRIVFIAQNVPRHFPARLLAAIEAEVREEMAGL